MVESSIVDFCQDFYIPEIHKLAFHLPYVRILITNQFGNTLQDAFKRRSDFQDVLCRCDYAELVVAIFSHQIQY